MLREIVQIVEKTLSKSDTKKITSAVKDFNNRPWVDLGSPYDLKVTLSHAEEVGVKVVLDYIRREDIRLFHKEEGQMGNI